MAKKPVGKSNMSCETQQNDTQLHNTAQMRLSSMFPEFNKDMLVKILKFHNYDEESAINSILSDGGAEAIASHPNKNNQNPDNNRRNKKKKNKKSAHNSVPIATASNTDPEDSSSLHSSNIDFDGDKELSVKSGDCDENVTKSMQDHVVISTDVTNRAMVNSHCSPDKRSKSIDVEENQKVTSPVEENKETAVTPSNDVKPVTLITCDNISKDETASASSFSHPKESFERQQLTRPPYVKHPYRQRHGSFHYSKPSSNALEESNYQTSTVPKKGGLDAKCIKDLQRQTVSLQRIQSQVENKLDEASKGLKKAFSEVKRILDARQADVEEEFEKVKHDALDLLKSRQNLASELKVRVDRNSTDSEWNDLKADIKQFVMERKYDEELGKARWFQWSMDEITKELNSFGEVCPVKVNYSQRQHSIQSADTEPETAEAVSSTVPQDAFGATGDLVPSNTGREVKTEKDVQGKGPGQVMNHSRVYSNSTYHTQSNYNGRHGGPNHFNHNNRRFQRNRGGNYHRPPQRYVDYRQYGGPEKPNDYHQHNQHHNLPHTRLPYHPQPSDSKLHEKPPHAPVLPEEAGANSLNKPPHQGPWIPRGPRGHRGNQRRFNNNYNNRFQNKPQRPHQDSTSSRGAEEQPLTDKNSNFETAPAASEMLNGH